MKKPPFVMAVALATTLALSAVVASGAQAADLDVFVVTGVKAGDFLNMRSSPGASHAITGRIPHNGQGVVMTGEEKTVGGTTWAKVYWAGVGGWVSKRYLLPESQARSAPPPAATAPAAPEPPAGISVPPIPEPPTVIVPPPKVPSSVTPPPTARSTGGSSLTCVGASPTWRIDIGETRLSVNMNDGPQYNVPVTFRQTSENNSSIAVIAGAESANSTEAFMQKVASCSISGSSRSYPYGITAVLNNKQVVSGCCQVE